MSYFYHFYKGGCGVITLMKYFIFSLLFFLAGGPVVSAVFELDPLGLNEPYSSVSSFCVAFLALIKYRLHF